MPTSTAAVTDLATLESLYGPVLPIAQDKVLDRITPAYRRFIEASPFVVLSTQGPRGIDTTPRGDPPGFVRVSDPTTLLLPDRRGNNRLDTMRNLLADPRIGLLFLIPGIGETVRITGTAEIRVDPDLLDSFAIQGTIPATVLRITVGKVYYHCAKATTRSKLWAADAQPPRDSIPRVGALFASGRDGTEDAASIDASYVERQKILY